MSSNSMTNGELLYAVAKWAVENKDKIDIDLWDSADIPAETDEAKKQLRKIFKAANHENIYMNHKDIMPNRTTTIHVDPDITYKGHEWIGTDNGFDLIFHYHNKDDKNEV